MFSSMGLLDMMNSSRVNDKLHWIFIQTDGKSSSERSHNKGFAYDVAFGFMNLE